MINFIKSLFKKLNKREKKIISVIFLYISFVLIVSFFFISRIDFGDIFSVNSYKTFIQNLDEFYIDNKSSFIVLFCFFVSAWVLIFSFMSPLIVFAGYIFGPYLGTIVISFSHAVGATILFMIVKFYFSGIVKKLVKKKIKTIVNFLNKNINHYFLFYRILADFGVPSPFHNLIPIFTKIKINYYFIHTFVGMLPTIFAWAYFGHSIRYVTRINELNFSIFSDPNIYIPIILLGLVSLIPLVIKKIMFKTKVKKSNK